MVKEVLNAYGKSQPVGPFRRSTAAPARWSGRRATCLGGIAGWRLGCHMGQRSESKLPAEPHTHGKEPGCVSKVERNHGLSGERVEIEVAESGSPQIHQFGIHRGVGRAISKQTVSVVITSGRDVERPP